MDSAPYVVGSTDKPGLRDRIGDRLWVRSTAPTQGPRTPGAVDNLWRTLPETPANERSAYHSPAGPPATNTGVHSPRDSCFDAAFSPVDGP